MQIKSLAPEDAMQCSARYPAVLALFCLVETWETVYTEILTCSPNIH